MTLPDVIFLNGSTSAGKSSIARGLQAALPQPYLHLGIDHAFSWAPRRWMEPPDGFWLDPQADGAVICRNGDGAYALARAYHRMVRASVDAGVRVIVDEAMFEARLLPDWLEVLEGCEVFFVGVHCDLPELERRERERGDRQIGQARAQHQTIHGQGLYDLEIDTTRMARRACVEQILAALATRRRPTAFERLRATP